jgi:very-short-patch-repair endonuclease
MPTNLDEMHIDPSRRKAVRREAPRWRSQLLDMSRANRLLYYRDLRVATIEIADAPPTALAELLAGKTVRPRRLTNDTQQLAAMIKSLKAIERPAAVAAEEFGLQLTYVASGFASWTSDGTGQPPNAPVLLRPINFRRLPGSADAFELEVQPEAQLNPVLMHSLRAEHGVSIDESELLEGFGEDDARLFERLSKLAGRELRDFAVTDRQIIANFMYASQSMVEDLGDDETDFLAASDMVAALAGDTAATQRVRAVGHAVSLDQPDRCAPSDEHLILDADASQSYVINAVVAGQNLVVQGPPGTGKTQTIANAMAELMAAGKTVLFVAQKRAAITAVLDRLTEAGLGDTVLDLFDGGAARKRVVHELGRRLETAKAATRPNVGALQSKFVRARDQLTSHKEAMHEVRAPWGMSLLGAKEADQEPEDGFYDWVFYALDEETDARIPVSALQAWNQDTHADLRDAIEQLADLDAFSDDRSAARGWRGAALTTTASLHAAEELVEDLRSRLLPTSDDAVGQLTGRLGIAHSDWQGFAWRTALLAHLDAITHAYAGPLRTVVDPAQLPDDTLAQWLAATGDKSYRTQNAAGGYFARRKINKVVSQALGAARPAEHHAALVHVRDLRNGWRAFAQTVWSGPPADDWSAAGTAHREVLSAVERLTPFVQDVDISRSDTTLATMRALLADRGRSRWPKINTLRTALLGAGCQDVLQDLIRTPTTPEGAMNRLSYAFAMSVIEHLSRSDDRLDGVTGSELTKATADFQATDVELRAANASRVRRATAERLVAALDAHPDQHERVRAQVKRKRGFQPVRALVDTLAPDVLLAAKPIWAASPQIVSQLLPARQVFDVVIFDEASQVLPAAAIPSIARGRQLVVAGDDLQLPPTTLFTKTAELDETSTNLDAFEEDDETDGPAETSEVPDTESILDAISVKLGPQRSRYLAWHYRSRDERLIATSNQWLYRPAGRMMTTFPAGDGGGSLRLEQCPPSVGLGATNLSPTAEVQRVVDLVIEHARANASVERPESLGVIAFGVKHQLRIERVLEARLESEPADVRAWFAIEGAERFFLKNIERVQGDERDHIILTVGYGQGTNGKLSYRWGPVQQQGGERRINVAISRARARMTLVTSFGPDDVDPDYSQAPGFQLMRRFIEYAACGGDSFGDEGAQHIPTNTFEADIQARLEAAGLTVIPQYGVGSYRIDMAIEHPKKPGRFLLAVEADGASYHSGYVARERDRLRQQLLERRGWRFVRIWSTDYFYDPDTEVARVVQAYEDALAAVKSPSRSQRVREPAPAVTPTWDESPKTRGRLPVRPGLSIDAYGESDLRAVVRWVKSDDQNYSRDEIYEEAKVALGFQRNGKKIVDRLRTAISAEA